MNLNKALLFGNLTRDPELRALPSGTNLTSFSLATNRVWKDKDGNKQQSADFHNIVVFGRQAETVAQYLKKGSSALVEGRIQTRSWDADDGTKKYRTEIIAERVQFGPKKDGGGNDSFVGDTSTAAKTNSSSTTGQKDELETIEYPDEDEINPDDIPF